MTDYTELIRSLRNCSNNRCAPCDCGWFDKYQVDESCKEIIMWKAAAAIEELQQIADHYEQTAKDYWREACEYKAQLPKRGEWITIRLINGGLYTGCSCCEAPIPTDTMLDYIPESESKYCYSCGAKMEVQE